MKQVTHFRSTFARGVAASDPKQKILRGGLVLTEIGMASTRNGSLSGRTESYGFTFGALLDSWHDRGA